MGTSRRRTPAGARLNYGAQRRPGRDMCGDQENRQTRKKFKGATKIFCWKTSLVNRSCCRWPPLGRSSLSTPPLSRTGLA
jgi:hypothetical protein